MTPEQLAIRKAKNNVLSKAWYAANREKQLAASRAYVMLNRSPAHQSYYHARERCNNPSSKRYAYYGGRGITFEFESFEQFFKELGPRPAGLTLDRIDNNQGYKPGNVRWATASEQNCNKRNYYEVRGI